jgi:hypothetical protein
VVVAGRRPGAEGRLGVAEGDGGVEEERGHGCSWYALLCFAGLDLPLPPEWWEKLQQGDAYTTLWSEIFSLQLWNFLLCLLLLPT